MERKEFREKAAENVEKIVKTLKQIVLKSPNPIYVSNLGNVFCSMRGKTFSSLGLGRLEPFLIEHGFVIEHDRVMGFYEDEDEKPAEKSSGSPHRDRSKKESRDRGRDERTSVKQERNGEQSIFRDREDSDSSRKRHDRDRREAAPSSSSTTSHKRHWERERERGRGRGDRDGSSSEYSSSASRSERSKRQKQSENDFQSNLLPQQDTSAITHIVEDVFGGAQGKLGATASTTIATEGKESVAPHINFDMSTSQTFGPTVPSQSQDSLTPPPLLMMQPPPPPPLFGGTSTMAVSGQPSMDALAPRAPRFVAASSTPSASGFYASMTGLDDSHYTSGSEFAPPLPQDSMRRTRFLSLTSEDSTADERCLCFDETYLERARSKDPLFAQNAVPIARLCSFDDSSQFSPPVYLNMDQPFSWLSVGSSDSHKTATLAKLAQQAVSCSFSTLVFHHSSISAVGPSALAKMRGGEIPLTVLTSPRMVQQMQAEYPDATAVLPLAFDFGNLSLDSLRRVIKPDEGQLHAAAIWEACKEALRRCPRPSKFSDFCSELERCSLTSEQRSICSRRLRFLQEFLAHGGTPVTWGTPLLGRSFSSGDSKGNNGSDSQFPSAHVQDVSKFLESVLGTAQPPIAGTKIEDSTTVNVCSAFSPGHVVLVDLRDPLLDSEDCATLFSMTALAYASSTSPTRKLLLIDDAHNAVSPTLGATLEQVVANGRSLSFSLAMATTNPQNSPSGLLDQISVVCLHNTFSPSTIRFLDSRFSFGHRIPLDVGLLSPKHAFLRPLRSRFLSVLHQQGEEPSWWHYVNLE